MDVLFDSAGYLAFTPGSRRAPVLDFLEFYELSEEVLDEREGRCVSEGNARPREVSRDFSCCSAGQEESVLRCVV